MRADVANTGLPSESTGARWGKRYVAPADPVYVVGTPVPLPRHGAVALDQPRQRHLAPLESLTPD